MKRKHGSHNRKLCGELHLDGKYNDWTVTTAFYSAIHYLDHKLFPLKYSPTTELKDINEAHRHIKAASKHATRGILVEKFLTPQSENYKFLNSNCHTARYINYDINPAIADLAKEKLEEIVKVCDHSKP